MNLHKHARADRFTSDMQAYDALGPLAREAIRQAPSEVWVINILNGWRQDNPEIMGRDEGYSLTDPQIDKSVAEFVRKAIRNKFGKPPETFVVARRAAVRDNRSPA